jgi:large conductance mechanosensitive channel
MPKVEIPNKKKPNILIDAKQVIINPGILARAGGSQFKAFLDFIRTQGVIGLAVGLVLGGAVSVLVKSLVDNVVMPPLGLVLGSAQGLKGLSWTMGKTASGTSAVLNYGIFLNDFINFVVIALVVYFIVRLLRVDRIDKKN